MFACDGRVRRQYLVVQDREMVVERFQHRLDCVSEGIHLEKMGWRIQNGQVPVGRGLGPRIALE